jgi:hypothetical protein
MSKYVLLADLIPLLNEYASWFKGELPDKIEPINVIKPTHGNCCTCQDCGFPHDECVCSHNDFVKILKEIIIEI